MTRCRQAILIAALWWLGAAPLVAETPSNPLLGKWKHTSSKISLTIEANRLHFTANRYGTDKPLSLHADYGITRDQTVYGLITRVEGDNRIGPLEDSGYLELLDQPFCFRVRAEEGVLVIREVKLGKYEALGRFLGGVYKPPSVVAVGKPDPKANEVSSREERPHSVRVPSCVLIGNKLDNLALKDVEGRPWEYRRDHKGRLTLLTFWYTSCVACKQAIAHLNELQRNYGRHGLEVIGIACEIGTVEQQVRNVMSVRGRYGISYRTLLSGGGPDNCPVINQFHIERYPTLILLDETGTIIWRSIDIGMDEHAWENLTKLISKTLLLEPCSSP